MHRAEGGAKRNAKNVVQKIVPVLVAASALAVAACGEDNEEKNDYVDQVNEVTTTLNEGLTEISSGAAATSPDQAATVFADFGTELEAAASDLEGIEPPDDVTDLHDELVAKIKDLGATATNAADEIKAAREEPGDEARQRAEREDDPRHRSRVLDVPGLVEELVALAALLRGQVLLRAPLRLLREVEEPRALGAVEALPVAARGQQHIGHHHDPQPLREPLAPHQQVPEQERTTGLEPATSSLGSSRSTR